MEITRTALVTDLHWLSSVFILPRKSLWVKFQFCDAFSLHFAGGRYSAIIMITCDHFFYMTLLGSLGLDVIVLCLVIGSQLTILSVSCTYWWLQLLWLLMVAMAMVNDDWNYCGYQWLEPLWLLMIWMIVITLSIGNCGWCDCCWLQSLWLMMIMVDVIIDDYYVCDFDNYPMLS